MTRLVSVEIDLPSGDICPIGDPPDDTPVDRCAETGAAVCSSVCVTLPALRAARALRVTVVVETDSTSPLSIAGYSKGSSRVGDVPEVGMTPRSSQSTQHVATATIDAEALIEASVDAHSVVWLWTIREGQTTPHTLEPSAHAIFVVADRPSDPWASVASPDPAEALPWPAVLALGCEWARGATTPDDLPARLVERMLALGTSTPGRPPKLQYDGDTPGYVHFLGQRAKFECVRFLGDLERKSTLSISCIDASAIVVSLANLLGAALFPARIDGDLCGGFVTNCIVPLGETTPQCDCKVAKHQVAVAKSGLVEHSRVYDGVYRIDPDERPDSPGPMFVLPMAMPLGRTVSAPGSGHYLPQIASAGDLSKTSVTFLRPPLITSVEQSDMEPCDRVRYLRYLSELHHVPGVVQTPTTFVIPGYSGSVPLMPEPSVRRALPLMPIPPLRRTEYRPTSGSQGRWLEALFWTDKDPSITRSAMAELLAMADRPPQKAASAFGPTYLSPDGRTAFILLDGAAAILHSVGEESVDVGTLLPQIVPA